MLKPIISAKNIVYTVADPSNSKQDILLIDDASFDISKNGITAITGPNGAGKSLLLRVIANLIAPASGELRWFGKTTITKQDIAIVFQKPILLRRSVKANIHHALKSFAKNNLEQRTQELLRQGHLLQIADRPARVLSGGEQQRLALVRALAANPKILLLDEATASLDPYATAIIETLIKEAKSNGIKIIMVTHDFGQAKRLANNVIFMSGGTVCEQAPTKRFFQTPKTKQAKAYLTGKLLVD